MIPLRNCLDFFAVSILLPRKYTQDQIKSPKTSQNCLNATPQDHLYTKNTLQVIISNEKKKRENQKNTQKNESPKPNTPTLQSLNPSTPEAQSKDGHIQQMPRGVQPGVQPSLPFIHLAPHGPRSLLSGVPVVGRPLPLKVVGFEGRTKCCLDLKDKKLKDPKCSKSPVVWDMG